MRATPASQSRAPGAAGARTASRRILFSPVPASAAARAAAAPEAFDARVFLQRDAERRPSAAAARRPRSPGFEAVLADLDEAIHKATGVAMTARGASGGSAVRHAATSAKRASPPAPPLAATPPSSRLREAVLVTPELDAEEATRAGEEEDADARLAMELMREEEEEFVRRIHEEQQRALERMRADGEEVWAEDDDDEAVDMDYDALLDLGERLGDVRRERWREGSERVAAALRACLLGELTAAERARYRDDTCVVCQCALEAHETVKLMPHCAHAFHEECIDAWIRDNNACATCKTAIVLEAA